MNILINISVVYTLTNVKSTKSTDLGNPCLLLGLNDFHVLQFSVFKLIQFRWSIGLSSALFADRNDQI